MELLLYSALVTGFALLSLRTNKKAFLILLQALTFPFLILFLFFHRPDYLTIQVHKLGYEFEKVVADYKNPARSVSIGSDRDKDQLFVESLPPDSVQVTPSLTDSGFTIETLAPGTLVFANERPLNATLLQDGDRIDLHGKQIVFHSKGSLERNFSAGAKTWPWPKEFRKVKEPLTAGSFDAHFIPLSEIAGALGVEMDTEAAVSMQRLQFSLSWQPVQMNRVLLLGAGKDITINGSPVQTSFAFSDPRLVRIYSLKRGEEYPVLKLAASYTIQNGERLTFVHPSAQVLGMKESMLRSGASSNKPLLLSTGNLPYSAFPTVHYGNESKTFDGLFAFIQIRNEPESENMVEKVKQQAREFLSLQREQFEIVTDQGVYRSSGGEIIPMGNHDRILFTFRRIDFPWRILGILLALFLLKAMFQPPFYNSVESMPAQILLLTMDFFFATRFLFAFRASTLFPFSSEALSLALLALLIIPYLIFAAVLCARKTWQRPELFNFIAYSCLFLTAAALFLLPYLWLTIPLVLLASTIAFLRFHPRTPLPRLLKKTANFNAINPEIALLVFFLAAVLLQSFGTGEALQVAGVRIPLAILYYPVFLWFVCHYLSELKRLQDQLPGIDTRAVTSIAVKIASVFLVFLILSYLMADMGFFLLFCVPLLFLFFGASFPFFREYELRWKAIGALLAGPLVLFLFVFSATGAIGKLLPFSSAENRYVQRVLLAVAPGVLEESGLIAAEKQLGHQRVFLAYAHSGIQGGGYMNRPISSALGGTALNDNVPAAFLLNDFGIMGFAATLSILALWGWLLLRQTPSLIAQGAMLTLLYTNLYMLLSNCGIFLFTGKNVFFWGLNSISDIFHSGLMAALILVPLAGTTVSRNTDVAPAPRGEGETPTGPMVAL